MVPDQVMHLVTARGRFQQQVLVDQFLQQVLDCGRIGV